MLKSQTAEFLGVAASVDPIAVTALTVESWHEVIGHLDYWVAREALREHRRSSVDTVRPAHIIALAKKKPNTDRGIARPPAPAGKVYAVDVIEALEVEQ